MHVLLAAHTLEVLPIYNQPDKGALFDFLSQQHNKLCYLISELWISFGLAKTRQKPIRLMARLAVTPTL